MGRFTRTARQRLEEIEGIDRGGGCAYNYHCVYTTSLAWASPKHPLPAIREPRVVFERLFGAGDTPEDRAARLRTNRSMLDWIADEISISTWPSRIRDRSRADARDSAS